ncbi:hypothetical protein ACTXG5_11095 [Mycobacterium sp. Dal123C01]|uniref:hypothetical protein n=1 Tax=Mycobacterium sp. Dal123C01 TaxID=3457577 RepID=UPI00403EDBBD
MTKQRAKKSELERVAERGWLFTLRYMLLLQTLKPTTQPGKWATALTALMALAAAHGYR